MAAKATGRGCGLRVDGPVQGMGGACRGAGAGAGEGTAAADTRRGPGRRPEDLSPSAVLLVRGAEHPRMAAV